jgi:hypothetical protein
MIDMLRGLRGLSMPVIDHLISRGFDYLASDDIQPVLGDLKRMEKSVRSTNNDWPHLGITGPIHEYSDTDRSQRECIRDFIELLPLYLSLLDLMNGRENQFPLRYKKVRDFLDPKPKSVKPSQQPRSRGDIETEPKEVVTEARRFPSPVDPPPRQEHPSSRPSRRNNLADVHRETADKVLGLNGELWVLAMERDRLSREGRTDLTEKVVHVSAVEGDGLGYDIRSVDETGEILYIEVKTTRGPIDADFEVTNNEVRFSVENSDSYRLYRVFNFDDDRHYYVLKGSLFDTCALDPTGYRARFS